MALLLRQRKKKVSIYKKNLFSVAVVVIVILLQLNRNEREGNGGKSGFAIKSIHNDNHHW
jgi:hypothetical protein